MGSNHSAVTVNRTRAMTLSPAFHCGPLAAFRFPVLLLLMAVLMVARSGLAAEPGAARTNRADRLEWFRDQGFGLFIHWSVDSQLGVVISHSLVGASDDYARRFFTQLPRTFNPRKFNA